MPHRRVDADPDSPEGSRPWTASELPTAARDFACEVGSRPASRGARARERGSTSSVPPCCDYLNQNAVAGSNRTRQSASHRPARKASGCCGITGTLARCACLRLKFGQWLRYAAWPPGIVALMRIDHASPCRPRSDQAPRSMSEITQLLQLVNEGDAVAREALFAALYQDLRQLARSRLRRSETITLLDTASLVHESYLRYLNARELSFDDRGKFFAYAASVMRSIVVDEVRKRHAERRGGSAEHVELDTGSTDAMA